MVGKFPSRPGIVLCIKFNAEPHRLAFVDNFLTGIAQHRNRIRAFVNGNHHHLYRSEHGREDQALVIRMGHDQGAHQTR